jgi:hypothetical protein
MTQQSQTLALSNNWLDTSITPTATNASNTAIFNTSNSGYCYGDYWYPYYQPIYYPYPSVTLTTTARPVKLTMREVERLRVAAKKDKELKTTLEKFTDHIEVIVDF